MLYNTMSSFGHSNMEEISVSWSKSVKAGQVLVPHDVRPKNLGFSAQTNLKRTPSIFFFPCNFVPLLLKLHYFKENSG